MPHLFKRTMAEAYVTGNIGSDKAQQLGTILTTLITVGAARPLQEALNESTVTDVHCMCCRNAHAAGP